MIEYALKDENGNEVLLNDATIVQPARGSLTYDRDSFAFENQIVPNSSLPGSVKLGKTRVQSREIGINFTRAVGEVLADYRLAENTLLEFLFRTTHLVDKTNAMDVPVVIKDYKLGYDRGAHKLSSDNEILLECLVPFWSKLTAKTYNEAITAPGEEIAISNVGFAEVPPVITLNALIPVDEIQIYVKETKVGIQVNDDSFGTPGYDVLTIDCVNGLVTLSGILDRAFTILPGSGFFHIPVGSSTLVVRVSDDCTLNMTFNERFYV